MATAGSPVSEDTTRFEALEADTPMVSDDASPPFVPADDTQPSAVPTIAETPPTSVDEILTDALDKKDEGNTLFKLKKYKLAVRCYKSSLEAIPKKGTKKMPAAKALKCTLYSNLAMSQMKMEDYPEALLSCGKALKINPRHIKSLARRSLVHEKLGNLKESTRDQYMVIKLDRTNKKAVSRYKKIRKRIHARTVRNLQANIDTEFEKEAKKALEKDSSSAPAPPRKLPRVEVEKADLTEEELKSVSKGYCYFRRDQTEEEKRLIGTIAPKKVTIGTSAAAETAGSAVSAWNTGGTWEERDVTKIAKGLLEERLDGVSVDVSTGEGVAVTTRIAVTSVDSLEGSASTPVVRKIKRHLFDFTFEVTWKVTRGDDDEAKESIAEGTLKYQEVSNDDLDSKTSLDVTRVVAKGAVVLTEAVIAPLENAIEAAVRAFYTELKNY